MSEPQRVPGGSQPAAGTPLPTHRGIRVVAILAAYNEADIIGAVVRHLIAQGVEVYFIDNGSTDGTVAAVEPFLGQGVLAIENYAGTRSATDDSPLFNWESILRRKEAVARDLDADWFIHHDADEFRESPWPEHTLASAIGMVDKAGYNAIDFAVLNFWPTHDNFRPGDDVREAFRHFQFGEHYDRVQIKCWKKTDAPIDLASVGGHDVMFPDRRVFPIRFVLRHYPIRGQAHGARKVFAERRARFDPAERARGWHVQYDKITEQQNFIRDVGSLIPYDPEMVRLDLLLENRTVERLRIEADNQAAELVRHQEAQAALAAQVSALTETLLSAEISSQATSAVTEALRADIARAEHALEEGDATAVLLRADVARVEHALRDADATIASLRADLDRAEHARREAETTVGSLRAEVSRVEAARRESESVSAALRVELDAARRECDQARDQNAALLAQLREQRRAMVRQAGAHGSEVQQLRGAIEERGTQLQARIREVAGLRESMSWRVTRPLRWIHDTIRRVAGLPPV